MLIHLIRHTRPSIAEGICYGQTDLDLADSFASETQQILTKLSEQYDCFYSSPLKRCMLLADKLKVATSTTADITVDARLIEYNFGDWELRPWHEFKSDEDRVWMQNFVDQPAPNGENILTMQRRVLAFWSELLTCDYDSVAVVTHSGVQRLVHAHVMATPLDRLFRLQLDFGAVIELQYDRQHDFATLKHL